jgi:predicted outer membrane repeat protein
VVVAGAEIDTTTVLDGFTITAGHANDAPPTNNHTGGGLQNSGGNPVVRNVTFVSNAAEFGGGLYSSGGEPVLSDVAFDGNFADTGGGMYSFRSNVRLTEVIFRGNIASAGGGMYNRSGSEQVTNALFIQNTASGSGGGMFNRKGEQTVVNSAFLGNKAGSGGGGMLSDESNTTLTNVVFSSNTAGEGGGIFSNLNEDDDRLLVTNVTLSGNTASTQGGGIYNLFGGAVIANSILWDNTATAEGDHIFDRDNTSTVVHSLVEGGLPHGTIDGGGNLTSDPLFVNTAGPDGVPGTEDDDLRIQENSPAIDAGDNSALPSDSLDLDQDGDTTEVLPVDLDFHVRVYDGGSGEAVVDMGAYEFDAPPVRIDIEAPEIEVPGQLIRWNVYPNPFREQTTLHFTLRRSSPVEVALYNAVGRRIRTLYRGTAVARQVHRVQVDGRGLPSGIYLVRLSGAGITASQAMVLIR